MFRRVLTCVGASVAASGCLAAAAQAAGPPPPKAANGKAVQQVTAGVHTPTSFAFGGGNVFEGDGGTEGQQGPPSGGVYLLKGGQATLLPGSPAFVAGLAYRKGTLYVSGGTPTSATAGTFQILAWSGWNGTKFTKQKAIFTAPKGFQGFNGLAFGPDGRLYVGADVGLLNNNDHGAAKTPYVYDILSMNTSGKALKVFATGIRQPWQMAFPKGSSSPFVSDLGQDSGAKNPPDFLLRVKKGDNYGFPHCNQVKKTACKGFAKPYKFFSPHTDVMGLAIIGKTLFMSEFGGNNPGKVVSMPLAGGKVKTAVSGFVAPVVGLAANGSDLYIGELTGQVFKVSEK
jgi:glucose/arabinose dehydrogenase